MSKVRVFVSFDLRHDRDLYEQFLEESRAPGSDFEVSSCSEPLSEGNPWRERVRRRIQRSDQMVLICGRHTEASIPVSSELRIAQEEGTPYTLLWGRREFMCKKPIGAKTAEGMFSWTRSILLDRISVARRRAHSMVKVDPLRSGSGQAPAVTAPPARS